MKKLLQLKENRVSTKYFLLLLLVSFIFSLAVRYTFIDTLSSHENFKWNNELMLNTNDGYYYAKGAQEILSNNESSYPAITTPLSKLTAFLASVLPISFETLILWMPAVFASLIVIPTMLISRVLNQDILGFSVALLSSITWSYYNRTIMGYYDTDMLIVVLPSLVVFGLVYALNNKNIYGLLLAPIFSLIATYWHSGTLHIMHGFVMIVVLYIVMIERKNSYTYKLLSLLIISLASFSIWIKLILILILAFIFNFLKEKLNYKKALILLFIVTIIYLFFDGIQWLSFILKNIYTTRLIASDQINLSLKYLSTIDTIKETSHISFSMLAERISGNVIIFILSIIGYILLIARYRVMIVTLPMVLFGIFSIQSGLRFTIFAVPFLAFGIIYIIFISSKIFETFIYIDKTLKIVKIAFITLSILGIINIHFNHVQNYIKSSVLNHEEVKALDELNKIASDKDYTISWWDYGYPVSYYADTKVLIDGGVHAGHVNFPVSFILTNTNQTAAANMARIDVELAATGPNVGYGKNIRQMQKAANIKDHKDFLLSLNNKNINLPKKTRNIFFYFPSKMLNIFTTIDEFSNLNLLTGQKYQKPSYFISNKNYEYDNKIFLGNNVIFHKNGSFLQVGNEKVRLKNIILSTRDTTGKVKNEISTISKDSDISIIYRSKEKQFLVLDDRLLNSLFIKLYILEDYNKDLFELIISNNAAKIYKLKI